ncbi:sugar transferase [Rhizobium sp. RM]|uniref:sugar transferase n=1 Tax=Rhizobium sp. RM TaxID=2748079 RepID=UPI00110E99C2|nr:sugar transferase [Rhizobium sp. RM]NWJ24429.1 sugar transferase [Rhizobium sp. RM]TMV16250.1 sugar transferase [Rhizobium sp. Td3]
MLGIKGSPRAAFQSAASQSAIAFEEPDVELSQDQSTFSALARGQFATKRAIDIAGASIALMALAPVLLTVAALVKIDSKGPVLFSQIRWGMNGRRIRVYKFRSMRTDLCDASGVAQTVKDDPRVTRVGAILRRSNIDELPQLLNVLKGDMSLVGPRCHAIGMLAAGRLYEDLVPHYHLRHRMRPGITGLAQMRGLRGPTDRSDKARARIVSDLYYIDNFSVWLDIKIMIGTVISELRGGKGF